MLYLDVYNAPLKKWLEENSHLDETTLVGAMVKSNYSESYAQAVVSLTKRQLLNKAASATAQEVAEDPVRLQTQQQRAYVKTFQLINSNEINKTEEVRSNPSSSVSAQPSTESPSRDQDRWNVMPSDGYNGFVPCVLDRLHDRSTWIEDNKGKRYPIAFLRKDKGILQVLNVISDAEAKEIIKASKPNLSKSLVINESKASESVADSRRDSMGGYIGTGANAVVDLVDRRLAALFGHPLENGESLQVLNYKPGGQYEAHVDYFQTNTAYGAEVTRKSGNRLVTILLYLNDVEDGGCTSFPKVDERIRPIKGSALYFEYYNAELSAFDRNSLHAGEPVLAGEKWVATRWVHARPWL